MELTELEIDLVKDAVATGELQSIAVLAEVQLALVGGGIGDFIAG